MSAPAETGATVATEAGLPTAELPQEFSARNLRRRTLQALAAIGVLVAVVQLANRWIGAGDGVARSGERRRWTRPRRVDPLSGRDGRRTDREALGCLLPDQERSELRRGRRDRS